MLRPRRVLALVALVARTVLVGIVGYLGVLTVAAVGAFGRRTAERGEQVRPTRRFVVLIPAHDEETVIGSTLASLRTVDYPPELVAVHVVADHCGDGTADVCRSHGIDVHERGDPDRPGKGPALEWLLARLERHGALGDAVVFVDADTTVDPGFLRAAHAALFRGATVVQGHYAVQDDGTSPVVAFRAAAMAARNFLRPLGRVALGGSAGLMGNGMVFTREALQGRQWSDHLTEDAELAIELLLAGTRVSFAPLARVAAEMPDTVAAARTQQERWERGRIDLVRRYLPSLARRAVVGGPPGRRASIDGALDLLTPPVSVLGAGIAAWLASGVFRVARRDRRGPSELLAATATATVLAGHVVAALRLTDAPRSSYTSLLGAPRFVAWKATLWVRVLMRGQGVTWTRTSRNVRGQDAA